MQQGYDISVNKIRAHLKQERSGHARIYDCKRSCSPFPCED